MALLGFVDPLKFPHTPPPPQFNWLLRSPPNYFGLTFLGLPPKIRGGRHYHEIYIYIYLGMLSHASPPNIPASVNCFYEYLSTQKKVFSLTRIILKILPINHFEVLWATLGMLNHT